MGALAYIEGITSTTSRPIGMSHRQMSRIIDSLKSIINIILNTINLKQALTKISDTMCYLKYASNYQKTFTL